MIKPTITSILEKLKKAVVNPGRLPPPLIDELTAKKYHLVRDPLDHANVVSKHQKAMVLKASDESFGLAANLLNAHQVIHDPDAFNPYGHTQDTWENRRHVSLLEPAHPFDAVLIRAQRAQPHYVKISTLGHEGNAARYTMLFGSLCEPDHDPLLASWITLLDLTVLTPNSEHFFARPSQGFFDHYILLNLWGDGGIARLGIYEHEALNSAERSLFSQDGNIRPGSPLPSCLKPPIQVLKAASSRASENSPKNWASRSANAAVLSCSNQFYSNASHTLADEPPCGMSDGFESRRSDNHTPNPEFTLLQQQLRTDLNDSRLNLNHADFVMYRLQESIAIHTVVLDFSFFVLNNPFAVQILVSATGTDWTPLTPITRVKEFAGSRWTVHPPTQQGQFVKIWLLPDGGFNRLYILGNQV